MLYLEGFLDSLWMNFMCENSLWISVHSDNWQQLESQAWNELGWSFFFQTQRGSSGVTGTGWVIHPLDPFLKFNETSGETTEVPFKPAAIGWAILFAFLCFILLFVESQVAELLISGKLWFKN